LTRGAITLHVSILTVRRQLFALPFVIGIKPFFAKSTSIVVILICKNDPAAIRGQVFAASVLIDGHSLTARDAVSGGVGCRAVFGQ
jgi:hypothetical protein